MGTVLNTLFTLAPGVTVVDKRHLDADLAARLPDAQFVLTISHSRKNSLLVEKHAVTLLAQFVEPTTIASGVARALAADDLDPAESAGDAVRFIEEAITRGILERASGVPAATRTKAPRRTEEQPGLRAELQGVYTWLTTLRRLSDTTLTLIRDQQGREAVLKEVHTAAPAWVVAAIRREVAALKKLHSLKCTPRVILDGSLRRSPFVVLERMPGMDAGLHYQLLRERGEVVGIVEGLAAIADAYGVLHERGWLHGDVHPRNVLVNPDSGRVFLVDFGLAVSRSAYYAQASPRGGLIERSDPDYARYLLHPRGDPPQYTVLEEVYCVASMLFELASGYHHASSSLDRDSLLTAITSGTIRPLRVFGRSLPSVERCLSVALRLARDERYSSLHAFASDLRRASYELRTISRPPMRSRATDLLIDNLAARAVKDVTTKRASLALGRAGIVVSLVRCAQSLGEPTLLSVAGDLAGSALRTPVRSGDLILEDSQHQVDRGSVGFGAAGIPYAMALLAVAQRNSVDVSAALRMFDRSIRRGFRADDLAVGRLGVVVAISHLIRVTGGSVEGASRLRLMNWARRVLNATARNSPWSDGRGVAGAGRPYLGMAHGWAGLMFTASTFSAAASEPAPEWLPTLVDWMVARRRVENGLTRWPVVASGTEYWDGWCHGQAGHINALLSVYRLTRTDVILRLACDLGRALAQRPLSSTAHLCCGTAGVGYAFLGLFAATGEPAWLRLARRACTKALQTCGDPDRTIDTSLWKGPWGVACLQADLLSQRFSSPPVFGWDDVFDHERA